MKKRLLVLYLLLAVSMLLKVQTLSAQKDFVLNLPGGSAGANSNMSIPALSTLITNYPFTIEMWVKPSAITAYDGFFYDKSSTKTSFQFANATTGEVRFDLFGTANVVPLTSAKKLSVGKWQHLAVTVYADSAVVEIDGSFYAAAHTKAFDNFCTVGPTIGWDKDVADRAFTGLMDDIRIWNTARSRSEIESGKNSTLAGTETGLVAYYNFDGNNANDVTANALNGTLTGATVLDLKSISTLDNIKLSFGALMPSFSPSITSYTVNAPTISVITTGVPTTAGIATISDPDTINENKPTSIIICTSGDALSTTKDTVKYHKITVSDWNAGTTTGATSLPSMWGWDCSNSATAFTAAGSGACRYQDVTTGWYFNNSSTPWGPGRLLYIRWDGSGATNINSVFSYAIYMEKCKTYSLTAKYAWVNNASTPKLTLGLGTDKTGATTLVSDTAQCLSTRQYFREKSLVFAPKETGVYYLTIKSSTATIVAVTDMSLTEYAGQILSSTPASLSLSAANKSTEVSIGGNALTNDVTLTAPAGITLSRATVPVAETPCGGNVTVTYDYSADISSGEIYLISGALKDSISFTYTKPISIYERNIEVENNGRPYPLNVRAPYTPVDSVSVIPSTGFSVIKSDYSPEDFVDGNIDVMVNSSATVGTTGKLYFYNKHMGALSILDSVNVTKVAAYTRYYIQLKDTTAGSTHFVIGNHTSNLYPALTEKRGAVSQKFFIRRVNADPASSVDTFYIVQDSAYHVMRKSSTVNPNWDTEFGIPSNDAMWTRIERIPKTAPDTSTYSITNTVKGGNTVLGADAPLAANNRLYDDKTYEQSGRWTKWYFIDASSEDATLSSITLSSGTLVPDFNRDSVSYNAILPAGTASVIPTAVATISGAVVTGTDAVDVTSGSGTSTILVTATDGVSQMTYTINYTVAKSTVATLSDLKVSGTTVTGFAADVYTYNMELPSGTTTAPEVTATATDANAGVNVTPATAVPGATTVVVTAEDGTTQLTYTINFTLPTGVKLLNGASVTVYPSVTNGSFTVETTDASGTITVLDITGKVVSKQAISGPVQTVDVVNAGIYFIKVESKNASVIIKVVKTK